MICITNISPLWQGWKKDNRMGKSEILRFRDRHLHTLLRQPAGSNARCTASWSRWRPNFVGSCPSFKKECTSRLFPSHGNVG